MEEHNKAMVAALKAVMVLKVEHMVPKVEVGCFIWLRTRN